MDKQLLSELKEYLAIYDISKNDNFIICCDSALYTDIDCLEVAKQKPISKKTFRKTIEKNHVTAAYGLSHSVADSPLLDYINTRRKPSFRNILFAMIDERDLTDPEVYKRALMDRRLFAKIRANADYQPSKPTVIALALALKLSVTEAETLLSAAGYSLSDCDSFDLIIRFHLEKCVCDIDEVNQALDYFSIKPLGA